MSSKFNLQIGQSLTDGSDVRLDPNVLLKHVVVLGSSGSGKTYLCKVIIEEAIRLGVPVICLDSQGDIASLGIRSEVTPEMAGIAKDYWDKVDVKIWTPGSETGIPVSIQPQLSLGSFDRREDRVRALHNIGIELAALAGFNTESDAAGFAKIVDYADRNGLAIDSIDDIVAFLSDPPRPLLNELSGLMSSKDRQRLVKSLLIKQNGPRQLLLELGQPVSSCIDKMFGYDEGGARDNNKTRISIIALGALPDLEDRQLFIAAFARAVYDWAREDPHNYPTGLVFIDEAAPFLPPVSKPVSKEPLMLLLRQARKYGVGMMIASQSPGDINYQGLSQAGTKFIGRLTTNQEAYKIQPLLENDNIGRDLLETLPALKQGQFIGVCPDMFPGPISMKSRTLSSRHLTMTMEQMSKLVTDEDRK